MSTLYSSTALGGGMAVVPGVGGDGKQVKVSVVMPVDEAGNYVGGGTGANASQMQGTAANGAAPVGNPVAVAGWDGALTRRIRTDDSGRLIVRPLGGLVAASDGAPNAYRTVLDDSGGVIRQEVIGRLLNGTGSFDVQRGDTNGTFVQGPVASGSPVMGNPNLIAGSDGTNARTIRTLGDGTLRTSSGTSLSLNTTFSSVTGVVSTTDNTSRPAASQAYAYDGSGSVSQRTATAADATTGAGLLGAGILGQYSATLPTYTDRQFGTLGMDSRGQLRTILGVPDSNNTISAGAPGDGSNTALNGLYVVARPSVFNGSTWDRARGDTSGAFIGANSFWTEGSTGLATGATLNGTLRSNGGSQGGIGCRFSYAIAEAFSDVAGGTLYMDKTVDGGTTWRQVASIALAANTSVSLRVPISAPGYRARVVNGGTAQGAALVTFAYSLN